MKGFQFILLLLLMINEIVNLCDEKKIETFLKSKDKITRFKPKDNIFEDKILAFFQCKEKNHIFVNQKNQESFVIECVPGDEWSLRILKKIDNSDKWEIGYIKLTEITSEMMQCNSLS